MIIACIPRLASIFPVLSHTRDALELGLYLEMLWNRKLNEAAPRRPTILPNWEHDPVTPHQAPPFPTTVPPGSDGPAAFKGRHSTAAGHRVEESHIPGSGNRFCVIRFHTCFDFSSFVDIIRVPSHAG